MNTTNLELIESYHDQGLTPDRYYYQMNGKSAQENYVYLINHRDLTDISEIADKVAELYVDAFIRDELNIK